MRAISIVPLLWRATTSKKTVPDTPTALPRASWPSWPGRRPGKKNAQGSGPTHPFPSFPFPSPSTRRASERARARACFLDRATGLSAPLECLPESGKCTPAARFSPKASLDTAGDKKDHRVWRTQKRPDLCSFWALFPGPHSFSIIEEQRNTMSVS